jgi:predicted negative regulator of RcsB-dependent stress response
VATRERRPDELELESESEDRSDSALEGLGQVAEAKRLSEEGELRRAERLLRRAALMEHAEVATVAAVELGRLLEKRGELDEAMAWWDMAIAHGLVSRDRPR